MSLQMLFPHLHGFRLQSLHREADRVVLTCERVPRTARCPVCGSLAQRIHSRYQRTVWDLPLQKTQVVLHLHVRKFYCDLPTCPRRIFTERLPQVTTPHGRFTLALRQVLAHLGREHGGAPGARSASQLGIRVTPRAVLRFLHALPLPAVAPPHIIGLDDWAWKRRLRYGAVVVDLERDQPIALLAERSQEVVGQWLKAHPTITLVARDRSKEFAAAITAALPHAQQVADRWHVAKNLTEHLDKVVAARWKALRRALPPAAVPADPAPAALPECPGPPSPGEERYQQALALAHTGVPVKHIAQRLGVSHQTIYRWLAQQHGPHAGPARPRRSPLDWITAWLHERWEAGERDGRVLWEELKQQGYRGSLRTIYRRLGRWRAGPRLRVLSSAAQVIPPAPWDDLTPGKIVGWIIARPDTLHSEDQARLEQLCERDTTLAQARVLTQRWLGFIRAHRSEGIERWLQDIRASSIPAFVSFARSVERDKAAIVAGLTLPYSTGPVEGHITRLKLIKRQASGRASLDYLQQRFLAA